ncbi:MAG: response regulator [Verrucomicrobia bacterium]|nr:response regulator [Verrucomicrobiota bacterium]
MIAVPQTESPRAQAPASSVAGRPAASTPRVAPLYVVDDEAMVGEVLQAILQMAGFEVEVFQEPLLALHTLAEARVRPHLLLTDFAMGPVNGLELIHACKLVAPRLKTILIGGRLTFEVAPGDAFHPDRFLAKPFQPQLLLKAVRDVLALGAAAV